MSDSDKVDDSVEMQSSEPAADVQAEPEVQQLEQEAKKMEIEEDGEKVEQPAQETEGDKAAETADKTPAAEVISTEECLELLKTFNSAFDIPPEPEKEAETADEDAKTATETEPASTDAASKEEAAPTEDAPAETEGAKERSVQEMDADEFLEAANSILAAEKKTEAAEQAPKKQEKQRRKVQYSEKVSTQTSTMVNKLLCMQIPKEQMGSLMRRCARPENMLFLKPTLINPGLKERLPGGSKTGSAKKEDNILLGLQTTLAQGMGPVCQLMDTLYQLNTGEIDSASYDTKALLAKATDAVVMLSRCYGKINVARRQKMNHLLRPAYKKYVYDYTPSEYLFNRAIEAEDKNEIFVPATQMRGPNTGGNGTIDNRQDGKNRNRKRKRSVRPEGQGQGQGGTPKQGGGGGRPQNQGPQNHNSPAKMKRPDRNPQRSGGGGGGRQGGYPQGGGDRFGRSHQNDSRGQRQRSRSQGQNPRQQHMGNNRHQQHSGGGRQPRQDYNSMDYSANSYGSSGSQSFYQDEFPAGSFHQQGGFQSNYNNQSSSTGYGNGGWRLGSF